MSDNSFRGKVSEIRSLDNPIPPSKRHEFDIRDLEAGGFFRLDETPFKVVDCFRYQETDENHTKEWEFCSYELKLRNLLTGDSEFIEWEDGDKLLILLTLEELSLRDLQADGDPIGSMSAVKSTDKIEYNGKKFWYEEMWAANYHRLSQKGDPEPVHLWEFESQNQYLTIEDWKSGAGRENRVYTTREVLSTKVEVISTDGGGANG